MKFKPSQAQTERNDLLRAVEAHMAEMDMRALKPGRDRDDIDNDLYNVATRIREASGGAPDDPSPASPSPVEGRADVYDFSELDAIEDAANDVAQFEGEGCSKEWAELLLALRARGFELTRVPATPDKDVGGVGG